MSIIFSICAPIYGYSFQNDLYNRLESLLGKKDKIIAAVSVKPQLLFLFGIFLFLFIIILKFMANHKFPLKFPRAG